MRHYVRIMISPPLESDFWTFTKAVKKVRFANNNTVFENQSKKSRFRTFITLYFTLKNAKNQK